MDQNFQTSFIPKKPMVKERSVAPRPIGILLISSLAILFIVLLATGGLYFYKRSLVQTITDKENQLITAQNRFEPAKIAELQLLDKRLIAATQILSTHVAISPIFSALEQITMKTVRFTNFSYDLGADPKAPIAIRLAGQAIGYESIALQSDLFSTKDVGKNFIDPVFTGLSLDANGNVLFNLDFSVSPDFMNYKQALLRQS